MRFLNFLLSTTDFNLKIHTIFLAGATILAVDKGSQSESLSFKNLASPPAQLHSLPFSMMILKLQKLEGEAKVFLVLQVEKKIDSRGCLCFAF